MLLPELQRLATELGIPGTGKMRKSDLVAAISERQIGGPNGAAAAPAAETPVAAARADQAKRRNTESFNVPAIASPSRVAHCQT